MNTKEEAIALEDKLTSLCNEFLAVYKNPHQRDNRCIQILNEMERLLSRTRSRTQPLKKLLKKKRISDVGEWEAWITRDIKIIQKMGIIERTVVERNTTQVN